MNKEPKVSIIITCYNQAGYIADALHSALNQNYNNIEIVCLNDASTDNSSEIIQEFKKKYNNIIYLNEKNKSRLLRSKKLCNRSCERRIYTAT